MSIKFNDRKATIESLAWALVAVFTINLLTCLVLKYFGWLNLFSAGLGLIIWGSYILIAGFVSNGDLNRSIGGFLGQFTDWTNPTGWSWWIPRPFGSPLRPLFIGQRELDRTRNSGQQLTQVLTADGTEITVSYFALWHVEDVQRAARVEQRDEGSNSSQNEVLNAVFRATMDRGVRWFVSHWDADGEHSIGSKKLTFSKYLLGEKVLDRNGEPIVNDLNTELAKVGIAIDSVKVDDINLPQSIVAAREAEVREAAEAAQEDKDMRSLRARILYLMWGDAGPPTDPSDIRKPLMSESDARQAARTARGDATEIIVSGGGGDFTKGAAITANLGGKKK